MMRLIDQPLAAFALPLRARFLFTVALPQPEADPGQIAYLPQQLSQAADQALSQVPHYHQGQHNLRKAFTAAK